MKSTTAFGLGIAVGYWLYRDRYDIRAYKKRIEELERDLALERKVAAGEDTYREWLEWCNRNKN